MTLFGLVAQDFALVIETELNGVVTVVFNRLHLCYHARTSLKDCYRDQTSVFVVEDLSHSNFCSQNSFLHYNYLL